MQAVWKFGVIYFLLVFAAGFLLAPIREWVLVPQLGRMWAELAEMPVMLLVMYVSAGWVARHGAWQDLSRGLLAVGFLALAFMLFAELGVLQFVRGISLSQYIGEREPVSGLVYLGMLVLLALLPWLRRKAGWRF